MNHRGPLPLREFHFTDETRCGETLGDLESIVTRLPLQVKSHFVNQIVFLTVNHRGPLPLRELHSTGETIAWRDPGGSWACLRSVYDYVWNRSVRVGVIRDLHCINTMHSRKRKEPYGMQNEQNYQTKKYSRRPTKKPRKELQKWALGIAEMNTTTKERKA